MPHQKTILAVAVVAICATVSIFALYDEEQLEVDRVVTSGGQLRPWDTAHMTKVSIMVFEGVIKSEEIKLVYKPAIMEGDFLLREAREIPYKYLTIQVTEWLKDSSEEYADHVVIQDYLKKGMGKIDGKPALFEKSEGAVEYAEDERAIFFVSDVNGVPSTAGASQVFRYDDNGRVYLKAFADAIEPFDVDEFKAEIRANS